MKKERKHSGIRRVSMLLVIALCLAFCACSGGPALSSEEPAYVGLEDIGLNYTISQSSFGNKFGKIKITVKGVPDGLKHIEFNDDYELEYTDYEGGEFSLCAQKEGSEEKPVGETYRLEGKDKLSFMVDADSFYDCYVGNENGKYRIAKVVKGIDASGYETKYVAYFELL